MERAQGQGQPFKHYPAHKINILIESPTGPQDTGKMDSLKRKNTFCPNIGLIDFFFNVIRRLEETWVSLDGLCKYSFHSYAPGEVSGPLFCRL